MIKDKTVVSTKGQIILPKAIRTARKWGPGTRLDIEETADGVLLRPAPVFAPTRPEDVYGMLHQPGVSKTLEEMDAGIEVLMRQQNADDRH